MNAPYFSLFDLLLVILGIGAGSIFGLLFGYIKGWNACYDRWFTEETEEAQSATS